MSCKCSQDTADTLSRDFELEPDEDVRMHVTYRFCCIEIDARNSYLNVRYAQGVYSLIRMHEQFTFDVDQTVGLIVGLLLTKDFDGGPQ